jgi:hypothetical protein
MRSHHRPFESAISFVQSDLVQSTGGSLLKLDDGFFYLVMGHVFAGRYADFEGQNETDGPKASQHYLGEIRKFRISGKPGAGNLHVEQVSSYSGPEFKRRDLNVVPTVLPDGKLGGAVYGGVFTGEQLSFTHPIYFSSSSAPRVDTAYEQKMSGYACARLLLFDRHANTMYTSFFGGISHWRWNHVSSQFETVPLVGSKTSNQYSDGMEWTDQITTLVHRSDSTSEFVQPENHLPGALGTEAVFFPALVSNL